MYIAKLKNTLFYNKIINNFFIVAFAILLLSVSLDYYLVFIILFGYLTYLYIKKKDIFKYTLIILCIYIVFLVIRRLLYYDQSLDSFEGIVKSIEEKDYYKKITITNYFKNVIINDYEFLDISIGDRIFVSKQDSVDVGEIGIFVVNGDVYVKELGNNKLISHNDTYKPILLNDSDSIYCCGKVLGTV